jgi:hypothetical protein
MNALSEGKRSEDKQGRFLNLLKKWPVVLNKSQEGFSETLQILCTHFCDEITNVKISKKINNIKTETVL